MKKRPCTKCTILQSNMTQLWVCSNALRLPGHVILFTEAPLDSEDRRHPHCAPEAICKPGCAHNNPSRQQAVAAVIFPSSLVVCVRRDQAMCLAVFVDSRCILVSKQDSRLHQQLLGQMPDDGQLIGKELFALPPSAFFPSIFTTCMCFSYSGRQEGVCSIHF